jgi:F-type H+-transporting ATPase subunit beta
MDVNAGTIIQIKGQVAEVEFLNEKPDIHDILVCQDDPSVLLEVWTSAAINTFYCFALSSVDSLSRGKIVINTRRTIEIPIGDQVLGRVMNLFGQPLDMKGPITVPETKTIYATEINFNYIALSNEVLQTGIKAIDFFSPILKGGRTGIFGGAGVGKTILITEIIHNIVNQNPGETVSGKDRSFMKR